MKLSNYGTVAGKAATVVKAGMEVQRLNNNIRLIDFVRRKDYKRKF